MEIRVTKIMYVTLDLNATKNLITRWIQTLNLEMENYPELETETRAVWGCGHSAVIAYSVSSASTEIQLAAVKEIHPEYDNASEQWDSITGLFKDAMELSNSKTLDDVMWQKSDFENDIFFVEGNPPLEDEQEYKQQWRERFQRDPVINKHAPSQRTLDAEGIEQEVEDKWYLHKQWYERGNARREYLDELWNRTTLRQATARYLNWNGNREANKPAWESIPDHLWDRTALRLWWDGLTCPEISKAISQDDGRIRNRLTELRNIYGTDIVPKDEQRRTKVYKRL